jgi:hypothetical protein
MNSTKDFETITYRMKELALLYFKNSTPASASCQLKRWIVSNKKLISELQNAGYYSGLKIFTPKQVRIIVEHLGEP